MQTAAVASVDTTLGSEISKYLLAPSPDLTELQTSISTKLGLSPEDARALIYQVVLKLNHSLFPPITHLELILTEGCNLACTYCFEKEMLGYKRMAANTAIAAVDLLLDYSQDAEGVNITHFGGEPTLNFSAICHVTEYAVQKASMRGKSVTFNTTTNGVLLDDRIVQYFADNKIDVLLSVDGLEATHNRYRLDKRGFGTFDRVMKGLSILKKVQPWVAVKMTVMPSNVPALFDDVVGLYNLGVNEFIIGYATGIAWAAEDMEAYASELEKIFLWYRQTKRDDLRIPDLDESSDAPFFGCRAGNSSITVTIDGDVSPCAKILALNNRQLLTKLGDIRYGLTHIRNRHELVHCSKLRSACEAKGIAEEFQGGCFAANYEANGDLFQPNLQDHSFSLLKRTACSGCNACSN